MNTVEATITAVTSLLAFLAQIAPEVETLVQDVVAEVKNIEAQYTAASNTSSNTAA